MSTDDIRKELALRDEEPNVATVSVDEESRARHLATSAIPVLLRRERARRDASLEDAARVLRAAESNGRSAEGDLAEHAWKPYQRSLRWAEIQDDRVKRLEGVLREARATGTVSVRAEPRQYHPNSEHSWVLDSARVAAGPQCRLYDEALERLQRHSVEVAAETRLRSPEGERAIRSLGSARRGTDRSGYENEVRALSSGSSSGGSFVTPQFLFEDGVYALYNSYGPALWAATTQHPDRGYGLEVEIPTFSASVNVAATTENAAAPNSTPTAQYQTAVMSAYVGEIDISQQLLDRASGPGIEKALYSQLHEGLMTAIDSATWAAASVAGASVSGGSSYSASVLYGDIGKASNLVRTSAGHQLPPAMILCHPSIGTYISSSCDPSGRPLSTPTAARPYQSDQPFGFDLQEQPPGYTGRLLVDSELRYDGNIAAIGSQSPLLVCHPKAAVTVTSEAALRAVPETFANELQVVVQLIAYFAVVILHGSAFQYVLGAAYPSSPSFA
jgi:HK97 family phage major capsid protein